MENNKKFFQPKTLGAKEIPVTSNYNCCYDDIECWNSIYQGFTLTEYISSYPGVNSTNKFPTIESYLNLSILTPMSPLITPFNPSGIYSCWSFDIKEEVIPEQIYTANFVSMLHPNAVILFQDLYYSYPNSNPLNVYLQPAFNAILWIFNMAYEYQTVNKYTYGDIQTAIWNLLFTDINSPPDLTYIPVITHDSAHYKQKNVAAILNDSLTNIIHYPNMEMMICKTNNIIGNLIFLDYDFYNYNQPAQILCISTVIDFDFGICNDPEYIYLHNMFRKNINNSSSTQPVDSIQVMEK